MRHRWVNLLLLGLIAGEAVTGAIGLMSGNPRSEIMLIAHSVLGYSIVAVLGWKVVLALSSLRKPARGRPRMLTLLLAGFFLAALCIGLAWSVSGFWDIGGITGMSWHIYSGIGVIVLIVWHAWAYTSQFRVGYTKERRDFLRLGAVLGAGTVAWVATESLMRAGGLVGATRRFTGSYERGSMQGNQFPSTSWLNDRPAPLNAGDYTLRFTDLQGSTQLVTYDDLVNGAASRNATEIEATLDCTGGWYSRQIWRGVMLSDLLDDIAVDPSDAAAYIFTSVTGYNRRYAIDEASGLMLATHVGGEPLSHSHGAPVRLVAPNRRGYDWVKWVTEVRLTTSPAWWQPWLPLQ